MKTIPHTHPTSLSNPHEVQVTHLDWTVIVDFDTRTIKGTATYQLKKHDNNQNARRLDLDTAQLQIDSVRDQTGRTVLEHQLYPVSKSHPHLGSKLSIALLLDTTSVTIHYETSPPPPENKSSTSQLSLAAQWLHPNQTVGKRYPYLFTQCFAIHARSLLPCQDVPSVKMTYRATVGVPKWATAVLSAILKRTTHTEALSMYTWEQNVPISSYLLALVVGELQKRDISAHCAIWSEPALLDAAAKEFSQMEQFLSTAEQISGVPYRDVWGRYDLICMPPSLPFGGAENPCLTSVSSTLLTGDRSLVDVVAHEVAHSWTGNLVTNATWDHFWLNEGWTMWLQRKIMSRIHGNEALFDFDALASTKSLQDALRDMPEEYTKLVIDIQDRDPVVTYSVIAYEKGFLLLAALERRVGKEAFEFFFQAYIKNFQGGTLTTENFKVFFMKHFEGNPALEDFDWHAWLYEPGGPPEDVVFDTTMAEAPERLANIWLAVDRNGRMLPSTDIQPWLSSQKTYFLDLLQTKTTDDHQPLKLSTLNALHKCYGFAESSNAEILFRYCLLAIASEGVGILPVAFRFITSQGRLKYVRPLYRALSHSKMARRHVTREIFLANQDFYHPMAAKLIASDFAQSDRWWWSVPAAVRMVALGAMAVAAAGVVGMLVRRSKR